MTRSEQRSSTKRRSRRLGVGFDCSSRSSRSRLAFFSDFQHLSGEKVSKKQRANKPNKRLSQESLLFLFSLSLPFLIFLLSLFLLFFLLLSFSLSISIYLFLSFFVLLSLSGRQASPKSPK